MPNSTERVEDVTPDMRNEGSITQINDRDREHMRTFPLHLKSQVMNKIMSLAPTEKVMHKGKNRFEKSMITIHREGYGLIDVQPYETTFTSVWYRRNRTYTGRSAAVTMLMWEEGENDDTTTMICWKI